MSDERATPPAPVIEAREITKSFGHVQALRGASLQIRAGEILALIGDNGAGKSTLTKIICGALTPDGGELVFMGERTRLQSIGHAHQLGVETVYQDLAQAPDLSVAENMFLGREPVRGGLGRLLGTLSRRQMYRETGAALQRLGINLPSLRVPIRQLSGGQRQAVAVARAAMWATRAILMDEPTAALGAKQTRIVYRTMRAAAERGLAVVVISHDIPRMLKLAHRVAVMRHGVVIATAPTSATTLPEVLGLMLGTQAEELGEDYLDE
jgi:simple sugar transport system ATP-binding protein